MKAVQHFAPASPAFAEYCRLSISPHLGDWLQPRSTTGFFLEPETFTATFFNDCRLSLTCAAAAVNAVQCVPWEQTTQDMREHLAPVNPVLEEQGLVVAIARFINGDDVTYRRIYAVPGRLLKDGECVTVLTWKQMCWRWRTLSVTFRLAILKAQEIGDGFWDVLIDFERVFEQ